MSLIVKYPLDGNINDYSGNNIQATNTNATVAANGKIGQCYYFNGTNARLNTGIKPSTGKLSITMWIKSGSPATSSMYLSSGQVPDSNARLYLGQYNSKWDMGINTSGWGSGTISITTDWTFLTLIMDGTTATLYINGEVTRQISYSSYVLNQNIMIGSHGTDGNYYWNGLINDIRIYDHVLSLKEIKEIAKAKILHYNFDDYQEPTVNLNPNPTSNDWINSGTWTRNGNETDVAKPFKNDNLSIWSGVVTTTGSNIHFGYNITTISPSTTYTISVWYRQNRAGCSAPYIRTSVNNNSIGSLSYNGSTNTSTWPVNTWIRISGTATTQSNETGIFLSNYIGTTTGDKIWYYGYQVEQKDHVTPYIQGTRSGVIRDISGYGNDANLTLTTTPKWVTDSALGTGAYEFKGTTDYIQFGVPSSFVGFHNCTISFWRKNASVLSSWLPFTGQTTGYYIMATSGGTGAFYHSSAGSAIKIYKDGVYQSSATPFTDTTTWHHYVVKNVDLSTWTSMKLSGYSGEWYCEGFFDDIRIYNTELSDADIKELYQTRASVDNKGNLYSSQFIENVEPTINLLPNVDFSNRTYEYAYPASSWGGDAAQVYYYRNGGYNNLPYSKMIKDSAGTDGSFIDDHSSFEIISGKTYTISCYMKANQDVTLNGYAFSLNRYADNKYITVVTPSLTTEWKRFSYTFTSVDNGQFLIRKIVYNDTGLPLIVYWCGIQCEEKDHATPFIDGERHPNNIVSTFKYGTNSIMKNGIGNFEQFSEIGVTDGLVAYYPLNNNAKDYSGNNNHAIEYNSPVIVAGVHQNCYSFNGTSQYLMIPMTANSIIRPTTSITVSVWAYKSDWTVTSSERIASCTESGGWNLALNDLAGYVSIPFYITGIGYKTVKYSKALLISGWHLVTGTFDGTNVKLYIDGELRDTLASGGPTMSYASNATFIGAEATSGTVNGGSYWSGKIQDVRIYNRALTAQEIKIQYDVTKESFNVMKITNDKIYISGSLKEDF